MSMIRTMSFNMVQLINKGGFRERANRSRKYQNSENQQTVLEPTQYRAEHTTNSACLHIEKEPKPESPQSLNSDQPNK